ncbi:hypothetical protein [Leucothrix arctica]|uniref:DUF1835 domain-containing protein n=1 Tax=Leucothrix arctica TaxID=1481894 RepID=A0A317CHS1_9GAMM|nr:hypothetical protein [Leucothrix arctica]PWQ97919.1 hypothetical protein DKT75_05495 [Leucothrix arctica]
MTVSSTLNITNGDCAVEIMKKAGISGEFLPWRDVLHEGPVPAGLSLEELSKVRAQFIADRGWGTVEEITECFVERDNVLKAFGEYQKVILWFEYDLYDQLQVIQILDWFAQQDLVGVELSIICTDQYLGLLSPDEMKLLVQYEQPVTESHLNLSTKAWAAFRSDTPEKWCELLSEETSALPFLEGAVVRMLEEYPSCLNGLSRTAEQALKVISEGEKSLMKVFSKTQKMEERKFLGDASFWVVLNELLGSSLPLIEVSEGEALTLPALEGRELTVTEAGLGVLAGKVNWLDVSKVDRWVGGVHLTSESVWCWDISG